MQTAKIAFHPGATPTTIRDASGELVVRFRPVVRVAVDCHLTGAKYGRETFATETLAESFATSAALRAALQVDGATVPAPDRDKTRARKARRILAPIRAALAA